MESKQLLIPTKIRVGFQNRTDTYTKKLAYVIYYDTKGKLRKETSWQSWRDKTIDPVEFDNSPTEGFVLNKNVGGYKSDWNYRSAHIRVYDPRDFEFEISLENLLYILSVGDCTRGKGLEGKFVYAWDGTELVLLPENSDNYKNSANFTKLQNLSIKAKTLIPGHVYVGKKQEILIYIGKLDVFSPFTRGWRDDASSHVINYVFWNDKSRNWTFMKDMKALAAVHSDVVVPNYAELRSSYHNSKHGTKVKSIELIKLGTPLPPNSYYERFYALTNDGQICRCNWYHSQPNKVTTETLVKLENGRILEESWGHDTYRSEADKPKVDPHNYWNRIDPARLLKYWIEPEASYIKVTMESGACFKYGYWDTFTPLDETDKYNVDHEIEVDDEE